LIFLSHQLSEVNFFQHENSGERKGVFSGIVDDTRGVEYSLLKGTKVGAGLEQSGVGISSRYMRDLLTLNTITRRFLTRQELQKHCMRDIT